MNNTLERLNCIQLKLLFCSLIFLNPILSFAEQQCSLYLDEETIVYENLNSIGFTQTEVFRKNNNFGPQQNGLLRFEKWSELTFEFADINPKFEPPASVIGLTEAGQLYHLIKFNKRTIARRLSGTQTFKDFQLSNKGRVMAWDQNGKAFFYSAPLWNQSPTKAVLKRWFKLWGFTTVGAVAASNIFIGQIPFPVEMLGFIFNFPVAELIFSGTAAMSSGLAMASKFEHLNTYPNGFIELGYHAEKNFWIEDKNLKHYLDNNLADFKPPQLHLLDSKLDSQFTEEILD